MIPIELVWASVIDTDTYVAMIPTKQKKVDRFELSLR